MTRFRQIFFCGGLVIFMELAAGAEVSAQQICKNSDYRGVFSALALGDFIVTPPGIPPGPTARVAKVESDGEGNATIHATLSLNGAIFKEEYGGNYNVNPDCTIDVTLLIPFPGAPEPFPFVFTGMLSDDGREAAIILVNPPGSTVRIMLRKQRKDNCFNGDVAGSYLLNLAGTNVFQPGIPPGEFAQIGRVEFDGIGVFTAETQVSLDGQIVPETFSGVYLVDSSGVLTMHYSNNGQRYTWVGMLMDDGAAANLLVSSPQGAVIAGTMKRR